jgi:hypothetical protein
MKEEIIKNLEDLKQASIKVKEALQEFKTINDKGKEHFKRKDFKELTSDKSTQELMYDISEICEEINNIYDSLKG